MMQPEIGHWDFEEVKPPWNCITFSVGIFQWQEKKSGGLKRSKAVCRVKGYVGEPQRVFDKAEYLCLLLNNGICKPENLQKTYSVRIRR